MFASMLNLPIQKFDIGDFGRSSLSAVRDERPGVDSR
jgi:hypothetical protein